MVDPGDVDQSEAEHRDVGVGGEDAGDAGGEGHGQVARDLHQTSGGGEGRVEQRHGAPEAGFYFWDGEEEEEEEGH